MADRQVILKMTPAEEKALARLIAFLCKQENKMGELSSILGSGHSDVDAIGRINAALNSCR